MRTKKEQTELLDKLLGGGIDPEILLFALERARELILGYCRLKELPAGLENTLLSLCVDIYRAEQPGKAQTVGAVKASQRAMFRFPMVRQHRRRRAAAWRS